MSVKIDELIPEIMKGQIQKRAKEFVMDCVDCEIDSLIYDECHKVLESPQFKKQLTAEVKKQIPRLINKIVSKMELSY